MRRNHDVARRRLARAGLVCSIFLSFACASTAQSEEPAYLPAYSKEMTRHVSGRLIAYTTPVGAAEMNAERIQPYHARWTSPGGVFEEKLVAENKTVWEHEQIAYQGNGAEAIKVSTETRRLSRADLRSLSWSRVFHVESPNLPYRNVSVETNGNHYSGLMTKMDGGNAPYDAALPMPVFDGWIAGLAIAALPLKEDYWASLPTATHLFKGIHHLTIRVVAREEYETPRGEKIDAWAVEAEWVDLGSGDIYEPGAEGDGGVYHIAVEPGGGVPYVLKYEAQSNPIAWDGERLPAPN